jgi:hypothetical protein
MQRTLVAWIGLLLSCGGGAPSPCKEAVTIGAKRTRASDESVERAIKRCEREKWSAAMRTCVAEAAGEDDLGKCRRKHMPDDDDDDDEIDKGMREPERKHPTGQLAVTAIEPAQGDPAGGANTIVRGRRFVADGPRQVKVYFGPSPAKIIRIADDHRILVQPPPGEAGQTVDVVVILEPGGQVRLPKAYTYVAKAP